MIGIEKTSELSGLSLENVNKSISLAKVQKELEPFPDPYKIPPFLNMDFLDELSLAQGEGYQHVNVYVIKRNENTNCYNYLKFAVMVVPSLGVTRCGFSVEPSDQPVNTKPEFGTAVNSNALPL